jgi:hypothetical protein
MWKPINKLFMQKFTSIIIGIALTVNGYSQVIDQYVGEYSVTNIWSEVSGDRIIRTDTSFYSIKVTKHTNDQIFIINHPVLDTIKATVISDSIYIFLQTIYHNEYHYYMIHGSGKFYVDTIKYQCKTGGPNGSFDNNCIAVKIKDNSINELNGYGGFIKCYPNPFVNNIYAELVIPQNIATATLNIYSIDGSLVKSCRLNERGKIRNQFDLKNLNNGMFTCIILFDNRPKYYTKIVKKE